MAKWKVPGRVAALVLEGKEAGNEKWNDPPELNHPSGGSLYSTVGVFPRLLSNRMRGVKCFKKAAETSVGFPLVSL